MTTAQKRGYELFVGKARCVSCHVIEQTQALFTDNRFHNIGVGINDIQEEVPRLAGEFLKAKATMEEVDRKVLSDKKTSEIGRFVVTQGFDDLGSFKTPTLRNIAVTGPYMHDGSIATLEEVVDFYDRGGQSNPHLDRIMKPLNLNEKERAALVAFLQALTGSDQLSK